jgi:hypothetical protein
MHRSLVLVIWLIPLALTGALASSCDAGGAGDGSGEGEGEPGEGEGEAGEGEGEAPGISYVFERDGAELAGDVLDLGTVDTSDGGVDVALGLKNTGDAAFTILSDPPLLVAGENGDFFSVVAQPDTIVPPQTSVPFTIRYEPTAGGTHQGKILFAYGVRTEERVTLTVDVTSEGAARAPGLRTSVYEGTFEALPDFSALTPVEESISPTFDISARAELDNFAYLWEGTIDIDVEGSYSFFTTSDDGSRLFINDALIVDNDGLHGPVEETGSVALGVGTHDIRAAFFENAGGAIMTVEWIPAGGVREPIPQDRLFTN